MRDRLIELISKYPCMSTAENCFMDSIASDLADYLLANGVIVPPCKVGDTVYKIEGDGMIRELKAISCSCLVSDSVRSMTIHCSNYREAVISFTWSDFGKTVFLTREDAEKTLKGGEESEVRY